MKQMKRGLPRKKDAEEDAVSAHLSVIFDELDQDKVEHLAEEMSDLTELGELELDLLIGKLALIERRVERVLDNRSAGLKRIRASRQAATEAMEKVSQWRR